MIHIKQFILWFFQSPTPITAIFSLLVAYYTYKYQRKWNKRQHTRELTEWYAKYTLPKFRYFNFILNKIGYIDIVQKFSKYEDFDSKELMENLSKFSYSKSDIENLFSNITIEILDQAYTQSGGSDYIKNLNKTMKQFYNINNGIDYNMFKKIVTDLLNEIELRALQLNYCIYDEAMVYPILHQTYLKNIINLYYFLSSENLQDYDQFYIYTIWLYHLWNNRVRTEKNKLKQTFHKKSKTSKL